MLEKKAIFAVLILTTMGLGACSKSTNNDSTTASAPEDTSAMGAAASSVGGAIANSFSGATVELTASSPTTFGTCPTLLTTAGSGCANVGSAAEMTYSACSFMGNAKWSGTLSVSLSSSTAVTCGAYPTVTTDTLRRQFIAASGGVAGTGTRTTGAGTVVTIDHTTAGITANYQSDTFNGSGASGYTGTFFNSGGGSAVHFTSGKRDKVTILEHLSTSGLLGWDHTVAGDINITEAGSGTALTWTANSGTVTSGACTGGITVYHNRVKMMGQTCFASVNYNPTCCTPVSGTITTTFSKTSASGSGQVATAMNGKSESLTFTGCGSGMYTDYQGTTSAVTLSHCF